MLKPMAEQSKDDPVATWRNGVILTREQKAQLTPEQWQQFADGSVVRDLGEVEHMPEPARAWAEAAIEEARSRVQARIAVQERREAS
jgi:hypothetical protein